MLEFSSYINIVLKVSDSSREHIHSILAPLFGEATSENEYSAGRGKTHGARNGMEVDGKRI